jgi:hypothetical protein
MTKMHLHFTDDDDMENVIIDSIIVRGHPYAAGATKETVAKCYLGSLSFAGALLGLR